MGRIDIEGKQILRGLIELWEGMHMNLDRVKSGNLNATMFSALIKEWMSELQLIMKALTTEEHTLEELKMQAQRFYRDPATLRRVFEKYL